MAGGIIPPEAAAFLQRPLMARFITVAPGSEPHFTYVWFEYDGQDLLVSTQMSTHKVAHIAQNPQVCIVLDDPDNIWRHLIVNGTAEVTRDGAFDLLERMVTRYFADTPERWGPYVEGKRSQDRVVVRITPQRVQHRNIVPAEPAVVGTRAVYR